MAFDFPNSPTSGQAVTGNTGASYRWDGAKWVANGGAGGAWLTLSDTPPATPNVGDMWWDSLGTQLYLRYNDGNTTQWVPATNQTGGVGEAASDGYQYARRNAAWSRVATPDVGRNLCHNSLFTIAQRGVGPWTTNGYIVDRWQLAVILDTTSVTTVVVTDAARAQIGDEQAQRVLNLVVTGNAGASALTEIYHKVEGVARLAGKTVTLSFYAVAGSGTPKIGFSGAQVFGTGGSPSASTAFSSTNVTVGTAWARYSVTFAIPSMASKTLGTVGDDYTQLQIWFSSGATNNALSGNIGVQSNTFQLWGVQLEIGSVATPLEKRDPVLELQQAQRFYCVGGYNLAAYTSAGLVVTQLIALPVQMRSAPTSFTITPTATTNAGAPTIQVASNHQLLAVLTATATGSLSSYGSFTASADL